MSKVTNFKDLVRAKLAEADEVFNLSKDVDISSIDIDCTLKGKCAGRAGYKTESGSRQYYLRFNREAIELHWDEMVSKTISHEIAHIVAYIKPELRAKNHNRRWQLIDIKLGGDGSRTHSMGLTPARKMKTHMFNVDGMIVEMGHIRYTRMIKAEQTYFVKHPIKGRTMVMYSHYVGLK